MRRGYAVLPHSLLRIVIGLFLLYILCVPISVSFAQTIFDDPLSPNSPANNPPANPDVTVASPGTVDSTLPDGTPKAVSVNPTEDKDNEAEKTKIDEGYVESTVARWIHGIAISIGGWVAGLGGNAFEYAFDISVLKLGCQFVAGACPDYTAFNTNGAIGAVVNELWALIRDIFNVLFIFGLIFLGVKTILDADDSRTRKAISNLLIAALLVNFSLYFSKLLVDITNFSAVQMYSTMSHGIKCDDPSKCFSIDPGAGSFSLGAGNKMAGAFMEVLRVASWFNTTPQGGITSQIAFAIMAMVFLIIVGAVFLYGAFMMLSRFVAIVILLIFSPIMFLGWVLPSFSSLSTQWRKMFVAYCFYAPAYVFMLYLSLYSLIQIANAFNKSPIGKASYGDAWTGGEVTANSMGIFVFFFIGLTFLFAATKVAGFMSKQGAGAAMNLADGWSKTMSTGMLGRYTAGKYGGGALTGASETLEKHFGTSMLSRGLRSGGEKLEKNKYGGNWSYKDSQTARTAGVARASRLQAIRTIEEALASGDQARIKEAMGNATGAQIEQIAQSSRGRAALLKHAQYLKKDHVKAIKDSKSEDITDTFKQQINDKSETGSRTQLMSNLGLPVTATTPGTEITSLHKANKDQLEAIGVDPLKSTANQLRLTKKQLDLLEELKNDGKISQSDFDDIKKNREDAMLTLAQLPNLDDTINGTSTFKKRDLFRSAEAVPDLPPKVIEALATVLPRNALRQIAQKSDAATQKKVRSAIMRQTGAGGAAVVKAPTLPAGKTYTDLDPGTLTPGEQMYVFLNFDDIGKDLGK